MAKELLKRSEVREEDTWRVEDLYPSLEAWNTDVEQVRKNTEMIAEYRGRLGESAETLYQVLKLEDDTDILREKASSYARKCSDVDKSNAENQARLMQTHTLHVDCKEKTSFLIPELLAIPEKQLECFFAEKPELLLFRNNIDEVLRRKAHMLSADMEELLAATGDMISAPANIFSMFNNADLTFPEITDGNGEKVRLTHARYIAFMRSKNREVRKEAFQALYGTYQRYRNTLAALFQSKVKAHYFYAKARKYDSCLQAAVDASNVPESVYHNLLESVHRNMDKMYRYMALRKKLLGSDELHMYDLYVPMVKDADVKIPFEEAEKTVYEALAPLGEEYRRVVKEGFENRWIDVYENVGKVSGAYSSGTYGCHPFVLLNYSEKMGDMFTLAHEMGHAMHSYLSNKNQPHTDALYETFVAEVASTCNEVLLVRYLLNRTTDKVQRAHLINQFLESFRGTVFRQTMLAEYELKVHEMCERGESLTPDVLSRLYYELNQQYFGDAVIVDEEIAMEWARIPHFYYNFYLYQYATGFSAAVALANRILSEGQPAVDDYLKFLGSGSSKPPIELLKLAGVDMTTAAPIDSALGMFAELLDEMEELML